MKFIFGFGFIIHVWQVMFRILEVWIMPSVYITRCQKGIRLLWMLWLFSWAGQFMWLRLLSCLMRCQRKIWFLGVRDQLEIDAIASFVPCRTTEPNMPIKKLMLILLKKWMQLLAEHSCQRYLKILNAYFILFYFFKVFLALHMIKTYLH